MHQECCLRLAKMLRSKDVEQERKLNNPARLLGQLGNIRMIRARGVLSYGP